MTSLLYAKIMIQLVVYLLFPSLSNIELTRSYFRLRSDILILLFFKQVPPDYVDKNRT